MIFQTCLTWRRSGKMVPTLMWLGVMILTLVLIQSKRHQIKLSTDLKQTKRDLMTAAGNGQDLSVRLKDNGKKLQIKSDMLLQQNKTIEDYKKSISLLQKTTMQTSTVNYEDVEEDDEGYEEEE